MAGVAFPAFVGWAVHRQEMLSAQLAQARTELADQAVVEERRRIARDVHDQPWLGTGEIGGNLLVLGGWLLLGLLAVGLLLRRR